MKLPAPIQTYFDADQIWGGPAPLAAFTPDAVVRDEGKIYTGPAEIQAWWRAAKAAYQHQAAPREISQDGSLAIVRADVSGQFPGSPAMFTFKFTLDGNMITALEIKV